MKFTPKTNNILIRMFFTLTIVSAVLVASNFLYAAVNWVPSGSPSLDTNAPAPINISTEDQDKGGKLTLGGLLVNGGAYINNKVKAFKYCDRNGNNCFKATDVGNTSCIGGSTDTINITSGTEKIVIPLSNNNETIRIQDLLPTSGENVSGTEGSVFFMRAWLSVDGTTPTYSETIPTNTPSAEFLMRVYDGGVLYGPVSNTDRTMVDMRSFYNLDVSIDVNALEISRTFGLASIAGSTIKDTNPSKYKYLVFEIRHRKVYTAGTQPADAIYQSSGAATYYVSQWLPHSFESGTVTIDSGVCSNPTNTVVSTGGSIMGEIANTGKDWPDIITCNTGGSGVGAGALFYVYGGMYASTVGYKFSDNMENSGNEVMITFNKSDGSYNSAQGVSAACTGRSIQNYITAGEAYYTSSGWSGGSIPVKYSWQQTETQACTASAPSCGASTYGTVKYNVFCASSANPSLQVNDSECSDAGVKPKDIQTCWRSNYCPGEGR